MKNKFEIVIGDEKIKFNGIELIRMMHSINQEIIKDAISSHNLNDLYQQVSDQHTFQPKTAVHWLCGMGRFSAYPTSQDVSPAACWLPCTVHLNIDKNGTPVKINQKGLVIFPSGKLDSYDEITSKIANILTETGLNDADLVNNLLNRLSGGNYTDSLQEHQHFLDCLITLIFAVETSRNNDTVLTALMLFDLIKTDRAYGRYHSRFTWSNAFSSPYNYCWDDRQAESYRGKFPMAKLSTGTGNLGQGVYNEKGVLQYGRGHIFKKNPPTGRIVKGKIIYSSNFMVTSNFILDEIEKYPQRHAVIRREISFITHWLENLSAEYKTRLNNCKTKKEVAASIKEIFQSRLKCGFNLMAQPEQEWLETSPLPSPIPKNRIALVDVDEEVFIGLQHYQEGTNTPESKIHYFHRRGVNCKLIPGYVMTGEKKCKNPNDKKSSNKIYWYSDIGGFWKKESILAKKQEECACPYCFSEPQNRLGVQNNFSLVEGESSTYHRYPDEKCPLTNKTTTVYRSSSQRQADKNYLLFTRKAKELELTACESCWGDGVDDLAVGITNQMKFNMD